jgi:predicted permease
MLETLRQDIAYALRALARTPGFALTVVATLALGIGANATMFSVLDVLLVRPPAGVRASEQVVRLYFRQSHPRFGEMTRAGTSVPDFEAIRDGTPLLDAAVAQFTPAMSLGRGAEARQVRVAAVSRDYFAMLGVTPLRGRFFTPDEDRVGGERVAVLGEAYWRTHFAADTGIIGRALPIGRSTYTVVGIAPAGFTGVNLTAAEVWLPLGASAADVNTAEAMSSRDYYWIRVLARLKPGADPRAAAEQATLAFNNARRAARGADADRSSDEGPATIVFGPIQESRGPAMTDDAKVALWVGLVAGIVLLVACANVANLLLARGVGRQREIAVRLGLGATRGRLLGLLLVESLVLGLAGGIASLLLAVWGGSAVRAFLLPDLPADAALLDWRVLGFTAAVSVAAGILAGIAPALRASGVNLSRSLKEGGRGQTGSRGRLRAGLVVAQVALTAVLLVGAGLFVRSLRDAQAVDLGFDPDRVALLSVDLGEVGLDRAAEEATYRRLLERLQAYPGVERAALSMGLPFWTTFATTLRASGVDSIPVGRSGGPYYILATPEYFDAAGIRLLQGRTSRTRTPPAPRRWPSSTIRSRSASSGTAIPSARRCTSAATRCRPRSSASCRMRRTAPLPTPMTRCCTTCRSISARSRHGFPGSCCARTAPRHRWCPASSAPSRSPRAACPGSACAGSPSTWRRSTARGGWARRCSPPSVSSRS